MSQELIRQALRQKLLTVPGLPVRAWENDQYKPVPPTPFIREKMFPAPDRPVSFGADGIVDGMLGASGFWQVSLFYPPNAGTKTAESMAQLIVRAFKPGTTMVYSGLTIRSRRAVIASALPEPDWYQLPITIYYENYRPN